MPGLLQRTAQLGGAPATHSAASASVACGSGSACGIWSRSREEITFDRLQKFWSELPVQARQELLRIDKQTLFEQARKNLYCSRCNGLLLESFTQIVLYGKSLQQEGLGMHLPSTTGTSDSHLKVGELDDVQEQQDPSVHPWGGLTTTRDGILSLLDCFITAKSLRTLQNVFDNARVRERERELLYPDACGGGGRGWISQGIANYGRVHGTRETCALHTARLSCDTLVDFWSALGEETRSSLLQMKEEDFIERLMYRFDSKRFCRDCRRNVIREFKELKELKRMRREPRCTSWFCVADTAFQYEVSEDTVRADWHQCFPDTVGIYHHFEWAIGTAEGKCDILDFEDVGMNGDVEISGLDLGGLSACFITLRAWKLDGRYTELRVKAHALKGQPCVHRRMIVGDGFVTITKGESIRRFFEHAEEAEEEDDDDSMDKDENDLDGDGSRPQKHAKSPELAREFLLDAATVIFKEQVEKAFREGTARQNAHCIFVSLALQLLEDRVHVACKEIITLEKQTKLLEEEEKEKREEEERKERRRMKEREKKLRRKERLKEKEKERELKLTDSKSSNGVCPTSFNESPTSTHDDSPNTPDSTDSVSEHGDAINYIMDEQSPERNLKNDSLNHQYSIEREFTAARDGNSSFIVEQSKSSRRKLRFRKESMQDQTSNWYDKIIQDNEPELNARTSASSRSMSGMHKLSRERVLRNNTRNCNTMKFSDKFHCSNSRMRDRYQDFHSCNCNHQGDYRIKAANTTVCALDGQRPFYRTIKYSNNGCYPPDKGSYVGSSPNKIFHTKQVWEKCSRKSTDVASETCAKNDQSEVVGNTKGCNGSEEEHSRNSENLDALNNDLVLEDNAYQSRLVVVTKSDCYSKDGVEKEIDSFTIKSNFPLDNISDPSSTSSSSAQNNESSSTSDSEDASQQSDGRDTSACFSIGFSKFPDETVERNSIDKGRSPPESSIKALHSSNNGRLGSDMSPTRQNMPPMRNQNVHMPIFPSPHMGYYSKPAAPWATNGLLPFAQPDHFAIPTPVGYPGFSIHYNSLQPSAASPFGGTQYPVYHNGSKVTPTLKEQYKYADSCGSQQVVSPIAEPIGSRRPLESSFPKRQIPPRPHSAEQSGGLGSASPESASELHSDSPSFSLFHFGGPMAGLSAGLVLNPLSSKEEISGGLVSQSPITKANSCSKEETNVEEYRLFSSRNGATFSFF
ncbi:hypothetical protein ACMD2_11295 [Ananas comosus]|uniref:Stress response protein NST1 n=1 Tax=Ananas comosus TaxID=4615 RepID=A0A199VF55_ANACO|nr:hypothetical protein ACMD2_11295 [Ananas comosus]